jgi:hypothetical protein
VVTRYAASQFLFAFVVVAAVGAVKAVRLLWDEIDDVTSNWVGLS